MIVSERGSGGGRGRLLLFLLPACSLECGEATRLQADTPAEDAAAESDEEDEADAGGADGDSDAEAEAEAPVVCGNGIVEPGEDCDSDPPRACTTSCGSAGSQVCGRCRWETSCCAAVEVCGNGCDDDCDTSTDEAGCGVGTACGDDAACSPGGLVCNESWGICVVPDCTGQPNFTPCVTATVPDRAYDICVDGTCVSPGCGDATCNAPGPNWALPDTNQRMCCFLDPSCPWSPECLGTVGSDDCATTCGCGQDAQYGWDATHPASERFTRMEGEEPVVTDNVTGLVWQGCLAGLTAAACDSYGLDLRWEEALSYCDSLSWGGFTDWGLPDRYELQSITDHDLAVPASHVALDPDAFATTVPQSVWSSSSDAGSGSHRWFVQFSGANQVRSTRFTSVTFAGVRCVRLVVGGIRAGGERFTRTTPVGDDQSVVADAVTGLVWQGCPAGQSGSDCGGSPSGYRWGEALSYCEGLDWGGDTDWSLPNIRELSSIVDDRRVRPAIDSPAFPNTGSVEFWSSTTNSGESSCGLLRSECECARSVDFVDGGMGAGWTKDAGLYVRCVRRGP